ncbi:MAG: adenosine deaminase [Bdellovibrionales bacterium GWA1_52_35]|nr:MAG: adenosine deaminase [Bdellovibrionales bacterium GWA1_52_35]
MQVELHRHLDLCTRPATLYELAQKSGLIAQSTGFDSFMQSVLIREPMSDLNTVLAKFVIFQKILDRPEVLERIAFEAVLDCVAEGIGAVEFRFSPGFVCEYSGLSWSDALDGFEAGMRRALRSHSDFKAGLICIASRDLGQESVERTVEFFSQHRTRFIGLDLAANECDFPCLGFEGAFREVRKWAKITVHAGEAAGPENIWAAIETLGARRIGHGISAIKDPKLMDYLAKNSICLEMCPTSNWLTRAVPSFKEHPLPRVLRAGVPVCINTDDPGIFATRLPEEVRICRDQMGLSMAEIEFCNEHARKSSFLSGI